MSFYLFRRYFFSSRSGSLIRLISWICLAGMTLSMSSLIIIISVMGGFGQAIKARLVSKEPHLVIDLKNNPFSPTLQPALSSQLGIEENRVSPSNFKAPKDQSAPHVKAEPSPQNPVHDLKNSVPSQIAQSLPKPKKSLFFNREEPPIIFDKLTQKQKKGVKTALVFEVQELILKSSEGFLGVSAKGYSQNQWKKKAKSADFLSQMKNDPFRSASTSHSQPTTVPLRPDSTKETLISYKLSLVANLSPGDELSLIPITGLLLPPHLPPPVKKFKVKGIVQRTENESLSIYYPQGLMNFGDFSKINYKAEIQLRDPEQVAIYQNLFRDHKTQNWMERNSTLFFALHLEKFIVSLFLTLAFIISCLGISSALLLLINQKGEDLAILHAMGLSKKEIVKIFTGAGFSLTLIGLMAGAFFGISVTLFLKYNNWNILPEIYQDRTIPALFMPLNYLVILCGALLFSWLACYLPTKYLSRIQPAELLKITGH